MTDWFGLWIVVNFVRQARDLLENTDFWSGFWMMVNLAGILVSVGAVVVALIWLLKYLCDQLP